MGANIKIQSDSKQFISEMQKATQELKVMSSELSVTTTKAELFGTKQEQLGAKSKELSNTIKSQNTIFDLQKQTLNALSSDVEKYKNRNTELSKSIADVETKLKESIKSTGEESNETKTLQQELNKLQREYQANEKAIDKSNSQIDKYKIKMNETEKAILTTKKALEDTDKKISTMKWDEASQKMHKFGNKAKEVGQGMTTAITLPVIAAGGASVKLASDMTENINKIDVVFGKNADEVQKWSDTTLEKFGISNLKALEMAGGFGNLAVSMGFTQDKGVQFGESLTGLTADISSLNNVPMDEVATALNSIFTGEAEPMRRFGVNMTEASLQAYALSKGIQEPVNKMTDLEKVQLRYNMVMDRTKTAQGDFARSSNSTANQTKIFQGTLQQLGVTIGTQILPLITPILQGLNSMLQGFAKLDPSAQKIILVIVGIAAAIGPLIIIIGTLVSSIGAIMGAVTAAGGAMAILTGPIGIVVGAIAGAIVIGTLLYKNWDLIKTKALELGNYLKEKFNQILGFFKEWGSLILAPVAPFIAVPLTIMQHWNQIKDFFNNLGSWLKQKLHDMFSFELPHIKLPHFSLTGEFSLSKGTIPHLGVEWYAKGGIMTQPTVFGMNGNNAMVGGEAGAEAVLPLQQLWNQLDKNFERLEQRLNVNKQQVFVIQGQDIYMDGQKVGRVTSKYVNQEMAWNG